MQFATACSIFAVRPLGDVVEVAQRISRVEIE